MRRGAVTTWPDSILPTVAMLNAEEAVANGLGLWCCPLCGGLNLAEEPHERAHESFSAMGWCQHDRCVNTRFYCRTVLGVVLSPELHYPAHAFDHRAMVYA